MFNGNRFLYKTATARTMNDKKRVGGQTAGINISLCSNMITVVKVLR